MNFILKGATKTHLLKETTQIGITARADIVLTNLASKQPFQAIIRITNQTVILNSLSSKVLVNEFPVSTKTYLFPRDIVNIEGATFELSIAETVNIDLTDCGNVIDLTTDDNQ